MSHCELIVQFSSTGVLFQKEGDVILIRTLVGVQWLDIGCTDIVNSLYHVQVALINNLGQSFHILFQNIFHRTEKSDIIGIQDDQCDILWQ